MSRFRNRLVKRVMAVILSGAMVMSCMPSSNMTAFASEAPTDTGGGYISEAEDVDKEDNEDIETTENNDAADDKTMDVSSKEETISKDKDNASSDEKDNNEDAEDTAKENVAADKNDSDNNTGAVEDDKASEVEASFVPEKDDLTDEEDTTEDEKEVDTKEEDVKEYTYAAPTKWSDNWSDYAVFKGSVFGQDQGIKVSEFAVKEDTDHTMYLEDNYGRAKIAREGSGSATYLYQLPVDTAFKLTARATVKTIENNSQAGFGLMARDDMLIDASCTNVTTADCVNVPGRGTDYVVAGTLGSGVNCFKRDNTLWDSSASSPSTLGTGSSIPQPAVGYVYNLSLSFDGSNTYTCQIGENDPVEYVVNENFNLKRVDKDFQYIGMFVSRKTSVNFDRIYLEKGSGDNKEVIMDQRSNVSGTITGIDGAVDDLKVIFTDKDKIEKEVDITKDGDTYKYETQLYAGEYSVKLSDTNYTLSSGSTLTVENKAAKELDANPHDIAVQGVSRVTVSGTLDIPEDANLNDLTLTFSMDGDSVNATITGTSYTAELVSGATYDVIAKATYIDDYTYDVKSITVGSEAKVIKFTKKPMYDVEVKVVSFDNKVDVSGSEITFTEIKTETEDNANSATYTFIIGTDKIQLRDGNYSVSTNIAVKYPYQLTCPELEVKGGNKTYTLNFKERLAWDFTIADPVLTDSVKQTYKNPDDPDGDQEYHGLYVNTDPSGKFEVRIADKKVQVNATTQVKIPVSGRGTVAISSVNGGGGPITGHGDFTLKRITSKDQDASTVADQNVDGTITYNENTKYVLMESTGNPLWLTKIAVTRDAAVSVSGHILNPDNFDISDCSVSFVNQTDDTTIPVEVESDGSYTVKLTSGHTYVATLSGNAQYGFADTNKTVAVGNSDKTGIDLTVVSKDTVKYSGKIVGFAADYERMDNLKIILTAGVDKVELNIDEDMNFTADLESNVEYTIQLEGVDDYSLKSEATIKKTANYNANIEVEAKPTYAVSGKFLELDEAEVTKISFTRLNDEGGLDKNYVYEADLNVARDGYSVKLRDGEYEASAEVAGYKTQTHVVVNGKAVERDLLFIWTDTSALTWKADLYVGYEDKEDNYNTVTKALMAAKRMSPSASKRITIHIAPGTYREQITVDVPYITFKNDSPNEKVVLTWYYGIGYQYYSIKPSLGNDGFYDPEYAYDKTQKHTAFRWGCTVRVRATDFRAEYITFENSFNRYLTQEEIEDGVEPTATSGKPVRNNSLDVKSKNAGERAAALYIEDQGDRAEFYNCQFLSNQDTLGTGSITPRSYFKNCLIEGNTDYICGAGDAVFDNCELKFAGYSDSSSGGYITAASTPREYGYLFWNCTVTATTNEGANKDVGYLGRPWFTVQKDESGNPIANQKRATVTFVNTVLDRADIIKPVGWDEMSGTKPEDAIYKEYNTTVKGGGAADTSKRTAGTVVSENPVTDMTVYFGDWTPSYYNYVAAPTSETTPGTVAKGTEIVLKCDTEGAVIRYTTNGDAPTANSTVYEEGKPIVLNTEGEVVIKAIAFMGDAQSAMAEFAYTVVDADKFVAVPTADPESGKVEKGAKVALNCATDGAKIYYTTDGSDPKENGTIYDEEAPIEINETTTITAIAEKNGNWSDSVTFSYIVDTVTEPGTVAPPTANPDSGTVPVGAMVTLLCEDGAEIYYTTNGDDPKEKGTLYDKTNPIALGNEAQTIVIKAVAKKGTVYSDPVTFTYTISTDIDPDKFVYPPTFSKTGGVVAKGEKITIECATEGASIYYTTNGEEPKAEEGFLYTKGLEIEINKTMTIRAIAVKEGNSSAESTVTYTVEGGGTTEDPDELIRLDDPNIIISVPSYIENKKITKPVTYVTYKNPKTGESVKFTEGLDYKVSAPVATTDGYYEVTFNGLERTKTGRSVDTYRIAKNPEVKVTYKVIAKKDAKNVIDVSKAKISLKKEQINQFYTGYAQEPELDFSGDTGTKAVGYEALYQAKRLHITYKNNVNAGKATVIISVKPAPADSDDTRVFVGSKTLTFNIKKASIGKDNKKGAQVSVTLPVDMEYSGRPIKATSIQVKTNAGKVLKENSDYTVVYKNNAKAGKNASVTVKGIGKNLSGSYTKKYAIEALNLSECEFAMNDAELSGYFRYSPNGARLKELWVTKGVGLGKYWYHLTEGVDYTAKYKYLNPSKEAGSSVEVTIKGKGGVTGSLATQTLTIGKAQFRYCIMLTGKSPVFNSEKYEYYVDKNSKKDALTDLKKAVIVTDWSGLKLKPGKDYEIGVASDSSTNTDSSAKVEYVVKVPEAMKDNYYQTPGEGDENYNEVEINYKVATNLAKDKKFVMNKDKEKSNPLEYDGRNPVEITQDVIDEYINGLDMTKTITDAERTYILNGKNKNIEIVEGSYKNNDKKGTASVTIRGIATDDGKGFYGTKVLKFKIVEK